MPSLKMPYNFNKLEIRNAVVHLISSAPGTPVEGQIYYDTTNHLPYVWNGSSWLSMGGVGAGTIVDSMISASAGIQLSKLATNPLARANHTGTQTASTISDFDTQVRTSRLDQLAVPTGAVSLNGQKITSLGTPTVSTDAVTKGYVDALSSGISDFKNSVAAATTANITLSGAQTVDGVSLTAGMDCLVKNQTTASENGIYTVASGSWTRRADADASGELQVGSLLYVDAGTANGGQLWVCSAVGASPWIPGTSSDTWVLYFAVTSTQAGGGLTASGNVLAVGAGTGIVVNTDRVTVDRATNGATVPFKYATTIGDGSTLAYTVTHGLGTRDVVVSVYTNGSPYDEVVCDVEHTTTTTCIIRFAVAPTTNAYAVVVMG